MQTVWEMNIKDDIFNKKVSMELNIAMMCLGIKQKDLVEKLNIQKSVVSKILSGKVGMSAKMLVKFCGALGVDMKTLSSFID